MNQLAKYGAVAAKVRTLWGMRLKPEDYRRMAAMTKVAEIAAYLRVHPRWGRALEGSPLTEMRRGELELLLREYCLEEFLRLYSYLEAGDKELVRLPVLTLELEQIMRYLRLARTGRAAEYSFQPSAFFARHSKINYRALSNASTYEGLLEAVSGTGFAPVLQKLELEEGGFPSFVQMEAAALGHYYRSRYQLAEKRPRGALRDRLLANIGLQAEVHNITTILRLKMHYPSAQAHLLSYLLPINYKLRPAFVRQLVSAATAAEVLALLKTSYYGPYVEGAEQEPEKMAARIRFDVARRGIHEPMPTVIAPLAFLYLTEMELRNIIHVVECVRYGLPAERTMTFITGGDGA